MAPADALATLSINAATVRASLPTDDHLPPTEHRRMTQRRANRVSQELQARLRRSRYTPNAAHFVAVPKRAGGSRPAAMLTEADRVVYEALVATLLPVIDATLAGPSVVYGPRGGNRALRWLSFERAVLRPQPSYVVMADVADFYAGIHHLALLSRLARAGGVSSQLDPLGDLLAILMTSGQGLPQGFAASMALATSYLAGVDAEMLRRGWAYTRCQDDLRIAVDDEPAGQRAIRDLDESLAAVGLRLRPDKTRMLTRAEYVMRLPAGAAWERWMWRLAPTVEGRRLHRRLGASAQQALRWLRGRGAVTPARDSIEAALRCSPHGAIEEEDEHRLVAAALGVLGAAGAAVVTELAPAVLRRYPSETPLVVRSLAALLQGPDRDAAQAVLENEVTDGGLIWPSQRAWLYWALCPVAAKVTGAVVSEAEATVNSPTEWVCRTQAALLLAARGDLDPVIRRSLLESAPAPLRDAFEGIPVPRGAVTPAGRRKVT